MEQDKERKSIAYKNLLLAVNKSAKIAQGKMKLSIDSLEYNYLNRFLYSDMYVNDLIYEASKQDPTLLSKYDTERVVGYTMNCCFYNAAFVNVRIYKDLNGPHGEYLAEKNIGYTDNKMKILSTFLQLPGILVTFDNENNFEINEFNLIMNNVANTKKEINDLKECFSKELISYKELLQSALKSATKAKEIIQKCNGNPIFLYCNIYMEELIKLLKQTPCVEIISDFSVEKICCKIHCLIKGVGFVNVRNNRDYKGRFSECYRMMYYGDTEERMKAITSELKLPGILVTFDENDDFEITQFGYNDLLVTDEK